MNFAKSKTIPPLASGRTDDGTPADIVSAWVEVHGNFCIAILLILFFLSVLTEAFRRPFWYDEMFTYSLAMMPDWHHIRAAMPPDGNPPLYVFLARLFLPWMHPEELALRFPSLLAYTASLWLLFTFVRRRYGSSCGILAALLLGSHPFAKYYASEARPYALVLFFTCLGLLSWQSATDPERPRRRYLPLLTFSVAGAILSHHLGMAGLGIALLLGEGARLLVRRRFDVGVLAAVAIGLCPLIATVPMMRATKAAILEDASVNQALTIHSLFVSYVDPSLDWIKLFLLMAFLSAAIFLAGHGLAGLSRMRGRWPWHEAAALCGGALTLVFVFSVLKFSTGYYAGPRYGFAVFVCLSALCAGIAGLFPKSVQIVLCLLALGSLPKPHRLRHAVSEEVTCLHALPREPLAIPRGVHYPTAWHYSEPEIRERLFYPFGAEKEATGQRWIESSAIIEARTLMPMHAEPFHEFLGHEHAFLMVSDDVGQPDEAEFAKYLIQHGYHEETLNIQACHDGGFKVERVSR
jgi:hypothetical protein